MLAAAPFRHCGLTFVTSFFLHAGFLHLLGNLYFFLVFGDNVEEALGGPRYLLLLAASALLGDILHILVDPRPTVLLTGASGGISGIIVYYALQFPKTRIGMLIFFSWYRVPVGVMVIFWLLLQILGAIRELAGLGNVSALAHLGGAMAGFLFWLVLRRTSAGSNSLRARP